MPSGYGIGKGWSIQHALAQRAGGLRTLTRDRRTLKGVRANGLQRLCAGLWLDLGGFGKGYSWTACGGNMSASAPETTKLLPKTIKFHPKIAEHRLGSGLEARVGPKSRPDRV